MSQFVDTYLNRYKVDNTGNTQLTAVPAIDYSKNTQDSESVQDTQNSLIKLGKSMKNWLLGSKETVFEEYPDIRVMYSRLSNVMDQEGRVYLNQLYKNGKLLSRDSNDGSSTLENIYKIMAKPRVSFLDKKNIIKETLKTLQDPYLITQNIGQIPHSDMQEILQAENIKLAQKIQREQANPYFNPDDIADNYPIRPESLLYIHAATCSAASIEFNLADRRPAEFARYVEGFTSPEKSVKTRVKYSDLSPDMMEGLAALTQQNARFRPIDWETIEITVMPDENAYIRADAQEDHRLKNTRSMIDVLMQSSFMRLGARETYNSLTDKRSKEVGEGEGLNQFEIAFVESIVDSRSKKVPVLYMELDGELTQVTNYAFDFEQTKKHFVKSLDQGTNIITGFLVDMDKDSGKIHNPQGHEILITGYKYDENGKLWFKYNDTDDGDYFAPSWLEADGFIPTIHHANVPMNVLNEPPEQIPVGYMYLREYNAMQQQNKA